MKFKFQNHNKQIPNSKESIGIWDLFIGIFLLLLLLYPARNQVIANQCKTSK